ncbi:MAG: DUF1294 domain-containing protein [Symbiobacterium sp.]|uniref:DUF1294 domain-containing protein n=1 Tax=Symbiobacterium sp. TaxID=1971213 RepID=UPI003463E075
MAGLDWWAMVVALAAVCAVATFVAYGLDKYCATHNMWRIPERTLLLCALLPGGPFGAVAGMQLFHHKTRKWYFQVVNVGACLLQFLLVSLVVRGRNR